MHARMRRAWLSLRAMLRGLGADARSSLEGNLLAALLLALQRVPPLLKAGSGAAARSEARAALRAALTQVPCPLSAPKSKLQVCTSLAVPHLDVAWPRLPAAGVPSNRGAVSSWSTHAGHMQCDRMCCLCRR
jgi:hypothetical protein